MKHTNYYKDQKGQALLFVIVAMTIALTVGINASVRTITSLSRTSRTDTASRALAAAEGGLERYLSLNTEQLREASNFESNYDYCPGLNDEGESGEDLIGEPDCYDPSLDGCYCRLSFTTPDQDNIISKAYVKVETYQPESYTFELHPGEVKEVNLVDIEDPDNPVYYSQDEVEICWEAIVEGSESNVPDILYLTYDKNGTRVLGGVKATSNPLSSPYESVGFVDAGEGEDGYTHCNDVQIKADSDDEIYGLRIRVLGEDAKIAVLGVNGERLPLQGFTITSIGRVSDASDVTSSVSATRKISIIKSLPYLPAGFDYAIYSNMGVEFN